MRISKKPPRAMKMPPPLQQHIQSGKKDAFVEASHKDYRIWKKEPTPERHHHWGRTQKEEEGGEDRQVYRGYGARPDPETFFFNECRRDKSLQNLIWINVGGKRQPRRLVLPDLDMRVKRVWHDTCFAARGRKFCFLKAEPTLKEIDAPKPEWAQLAIKHTSEDGWKVEQDHPRHFSKLPIDIQYLIFSYVLVVPAQYVVVPVAITTNWGTEYCPNATYWIAHKDQHDTEDTYRHNRGLDYKRMVSQRQHRGAPYLEYRHVRRAPLDASCLRTNRDIYEAYINTLYGQQTFQFKMTNEDSHASPPSEIQDEKGELHTLDPRLEKPPHMSVEVLHGIRQIESRAPLRELFGWILFDHFLRFLYLIGPTNAARLKSLRFIGMIKKHPRCRHPRGTYLTCDEDLLTSMRLYIPFIRRFCTGLQNMEIIADKDHVKCQWLEEGEYPKGTEDAVKWFLPQLRVLESIKVFSFLMDSWHGRHSDGLPRPYEGAETMVRFFKDRADKREAEENEIWKMEMDAKLITDPAIQCVRCGGDHVWAECHNLCNYCGRFGHWRKGCPNRIARETRRWLTGTFWKPVEVVATNSYNNSSYGY